MGIPRGVKNWQAVAGHHYSLTIPQFFNASHVSPPSYSEDTPCLADEKTGQTLSFADASVPSIGSRKSARVSDPKARECDLFEIECRYVNQSIPILPFLPNAWWTRYSPTSLSLGIVPELQSLRDVAQTEKKTRSTPS